MVRPNDKIVISWGNSMLGMVNALAAQVQDQFPGVQVIQGLGGLGDPNHEIHATELVRRAARALGAQAVLLPAPGVAATVAARDAYYNDTYVASALALARAADMAFVGIGSASAESILVPEFWRLMTAETLVDLTTNGAVGSYNLRYFDAEGNPVASEFDSRIIGLTLAELRQIYRVVGIGGGQAKLAAIRAALQGRLINVLVTDHVTAQQLLKHS
jgi:DNA-binding transcriptional regulator LsrR (DeoR family)